MNQRIRVRSQALLSGPCAAVLLGGCTIVPPVQGDGNVQTETRDLASFTAVENRTLLDVQVRAGQDQHVEVTCDSNLLQYIHTQVSGDTLDIRIVIEDQDAVTIAPAGACLAVIDLPTLERYANLGDGNADLTGSLDTLVEIRNSGAGQVVSAGIRTGDLALEISRAGSIRVTDTVAADDFSAEVGGSGGLSLAGVSAASVFLRNAGTGGVSTGVVEADEVSMAGSGAGGLLVGGVYASSLSVMNEADGNIALEVGEVDDFDLVLSGGGDVDAKGVVALRLTATLSGAGGASVTVLDEVDATLTGSGDLIVYGAPPLRHETATDGGQVIYQ